MSRNIVREVCQARRLAPCWTPETGWIDSKPSLDRTAWRFFYDNAGWATPPGKAVCAAALARAEAHIEPLIEAGEYRFEIVTDGDPDLSWCDERDLDYIERNGVWMVVLAKKCPQCGEWQTVDSLGGVIGDDNYFRVIKAGMAQTVL